MNKLYKFFLGILAVVIVLFSFKSSLNKELKGKDNNTIYFYNWGDYIDPEILSEFEKETGYTVIYETFDSNEAMITKVQQASTAYDLVIPSDYTIQMMVEKDLLLPLDYSKIKGMENIDSHFLNQGFDPNNKYSIPYFWGSVGILYNTKQYSEEEMSSWKNLWDKKYENEILIYDGAREIIGLGLQANGYSLNTTDTKILNDVTEDLKGFMSNVKAILGDEINLYMVQEEAPIGITFSGIAVSAINENESLNYVIPKEGSNIWFDNIVIPKTSQNKEGAYALINYLLRPDVAAKNADYVWYSTPNKEAMKLIDPEALEDPTLYPGDEIIERLEPYEYLGQEMTIIYNDLFLELKISPQSGKEKSGH